MSNRSYIDQQFTLLKRQVDLFMSVSVGAAGAVTLQKWNYPSLGGGANAWSYTAAPTSGGGSTFPTAYITGEGGIRSVVRTAAGAWTITLQDSYQRLLAMDPTFIQSAGQPAAPFFCVKPNTKGGTTGDVTLQAGGTIQVLFQSSVGGGGADPANGEIINFRIGLQAASEP
jgi:hypothetical protein